MSRDFKIVCRKTTKAFARVDGDKWRDGVRFYLKNEQMKTFEQIIEINLTK